MVNFNDDNETRISIIFIKECAETFIKCGEQSLFPVFFFVSHKLLFFFFILFCVSHGDLVPLRRLLPLNRTFLTICSKFLVSFCFLKYRVHHSVQKRRLSSFPMLNASHLFLPTLAVFAL